MQDRREEENNIPVPNEVIQNPIPQIPFNVEQDELDEEAVCNCLSMTFTRVL